MKQKIITIVGYPKSGTTWLTRLMADILECRVLGYYDENEIAYNAQSEFGVKHLKNQDDYAIARSHQIPKIFKQEDLKNVIYISRHPLALINSYMNYFKVNFDQALISLKTNKHYVSYMEHINQWKNTDCLYFTTYEKLKENTLSEIKNILENLGFEIDETHIIGCIDDHSFENKKRQLKDIDKTAFRNMYKGKVDSYKESLTDEQIQQVKETFSCGNL